MKVVVLGADGYIGFPLSMHLARKGFNVIGVDSFSRRRWVESVGSQSATPIVPMPDRLKAFERTFGTPIIFEEGNLVDYNFVSGIMEKYRPEAVVHLGEQASAPFSMMGVSNAVLTQTNNLVGTLNVLHAMKEFAPDSHLVKLGSMGEYRAVNIDIPEGFFEIEYKGRKDTLLFPRQALTDWYHWSKVYDSGNIMLGCEVWGLRSTDIMQGVVYGTRTDETVSDALLTRFDFDAVFGTVLNRFCAQAVLGHELTCYGSGEQKKPVISLRDTISCLALAVENPPERGEYRVFNQFDEVYSVREIAEKVKKAAARFELQTEILSCVNPRVETEGEQYFNPVHKKLARLGFRATHTLEEELETVLPDLCRFRERLASREECILPQVGWKGSPGCREKMAFPEPLRRILEGLPVVDESKEAMPAALPVAD